jgi:hypothetical protein
MIAKDVFRELQEELGGVLKLTAVDGPEAIDELRQRITKELQRQRALIVADEHFLADVSQRAIGRRLGKSHNFVGWWLQAEGPKHYVAVRRTDDGFAIETVPPDPHLLKKMLQTGYRVAPATLRLDEVDPDELNPERLWDELGGGLPVPVTQG